MVGEQGLSGLIRHWLGAVPPLVARGPAAIQLPLLSSGWCSEAQSGGGCGFVHLSWRRGLPLGFGSRSEALREPVVGDQAPQGVGPFQVPTFCRITLMRPPMVKAQTLRSSWAGAPAL